jgi:hypothetical protein
MANTLAANLPATNPGWQMAANENRHFLHKWWVFNHFFA